jgi:phosphoglycolate phosphatase-like HAD superfamily hydrolase
VLWDVDGTLLDAGGVGNDLYDMVFRSMFGRPCATIPAMAGRTDRALILDTLEMAGIPEPRRHVDPFIEGLRTQAQSMFPVLQQRGRALPGAAEAIAAVASATVGGAAIGFAVPGVSLPPGDGSPCARAVPGVPGATPAGAIPIAVIPAPERLPDSVVLPSGPGKARGTRSTVPQEVHLPADGARIPVSSFITAAAPFGSPDGAPSSLAAPLTALAPPPTPMPGGLPVPGGSPVPSPVVPSPVPAPAVPSPVPAPVVPSPVPTGPPVPVIPSAAPVPPTTEPGDGLPARAEFPVASFPLPPNGRSVRPGRVYQSVLTGNVRPLAEVKLTAVGLRHPLDFCIGAYGDDHEIRTELVHMARRRAAGVYGGSGQDFAGVATIVIGDTPLDIEAALAAGARAVGVATGPFSAEDLRAAGAHAVLPDLTSTPAVLAALLVLAALPCLSGTALS